MSDTSEDDHEEILGTPADICEAAETSSLDLLPAKSRGIYERCYKTYTDWKKSSKFSSSSEKVLMAYFHSLTEKYKPSTLWSCYSMLKTTIQINEKLDISTYRMLSAFMKKQSRGFQSRKSKVLSSEEVNEFLTQAPDDKYLLTKVVLVFGIAGACRKDELTNIKLQDLETHGDILLVRITESRLTSNPRSFTITDQFYTIVKKYLNLRPPEARTDRFFLNFRNGKCTVQVVGRNRMTKMPKEVARYLNLPNVDKYNGHCFPRTSAIVLADSGVNVTTLKRRSGCRSSTVAKRQIKESTQKKSERTTAISSGINLRAPISSNSSDNSQESPPKKRKIEDEVNVKAATPKLIENVENRRVSRIQNRENMTINHRYDWNSGIDYHALFESYKYSGFQATNFGLAVDEINKMLSARKVPLTEDQIDSTEEDEFIRRKSGCTIFLGYTSNMVSCGMRDTIRFLVQHKMVDCIVATAGGVEEDFIKCLAPTYLGDFHLEGRRLRENGINRIGNLLVPNDNYCMFEDWVTPKLDAMLAEQKEKGTLWTPSKIITRLGEEIDNPDSIYYWAAKNKIPVFSPALTDGSLGDMMYFHSFRNPGLVVDILSDLRRLNSMTIKAVNSGVIILGGGLIKHHICNANLMRNGADFAVYLNTAAEFDGSDSGARPDEAVSWGKIKKDATPVKIYAEASLVFPLLVGETFARQFHSSKERAVSDV